jgi:hypothetical protein
MHVKFQMSIKKGEEIRPSEIFTLKFSNIMSVFSHIFQLLLKLMPHERAILKVIYFDINIKIKLIRFSIPFGELSLTFPILPTYQLTNLPTYQLTNLPTYQLTNLPAYQLTNLPTNQLTNLPTYQLNNLPTYQLTSLPTYQLTNLSLILSLNLIEAK